MLGRIAAVARLHHHSLAVDGPSLDRRLVAEDTLDPAGRAIGVHQLRVVAGYGLVDDEYRHHPAVVFLQEALRLLRSEVAQGIEVEVARGPGVIRARRIETAAGDASLVERRLADLQGLAAIQVQQSVIADPGLHLRNQALDLREQVRGRHVLLGEHRDHARRALFSIRGGRFVGEILRPQELRQQPHSFEQSLLLLPRALIEPLGGLARLDLVSELLLVPLASDTEGMSATGGGAEVMRAGRPKSGHLSLQSLEPTAVALDCRAGGADAAGECGPLGWVEL